MRQREWAGAAIQRQRAAIRGHEEEVRASAQEPAPTVRRRREGAPGKSLQTLNPEIQRQQKENYTDVKGEGPNQPQKGIRGILIWMLVLQPEIKPTTGRMLT